MKRGEVYIADLAPRSGSEQRGRRPVVVVSHDGFNQTTSWRSIVVVPLTTSVRQAGRGPTSIPVKAGLGGLGRDGTALCHQVTTLDRRKLSQRLGALPSAILREIGDGLRAALDLD